MANQQTTFLITFKSENIHKPMANKIILLQEKNDQCTAVNEQFG